MTAIEALFKHFESLEHPLLEKVSGVHNNLCQQSIRKFVGARQHPEAFKILDNQVEIRSLVYGKFHWFALNPKRELAQLKREASLTKPELEKLDYVRRLASDFYEYSAVTNSDPTAKTRRQSLREAYVALDGFREILGAEHSETMTFANKLAVANTYDGHLDRSKKLYKQMLEEYERVSVFCILISNVR